MEYREIIREEVRKVVLKKDQEKDEKEKAHYDWVLANLIADLRDLEANGAQRWPHEPNDDAFKKYRPRTANWDEFLREFFDSMKF